MADSSLSQALELFESCFDRDLQGLREVLTDLNFKERKVNQANLNLIEYYFRNFDLSLRRIRKESYLCLLNQQPLLIDRLYFI